MTTKLLGDASALLKESHNRLLRQKISVLTSDDLDELALDLSGLSSNEIRLINDEAADIGNKLIMLATVKSRQPAHGLFFQDVIGLIESLKKLEDRNAMASSDIVDCASWLIEGYNPKQGLNLITRLSDGIKSNSVMANDPKVDAALASHFLRTTHRPLEWSEFLNMNDTLVNTNHGKTIETILTHCVKTTDIEKITTLYRDLYQSSNFNSNHLNAFRRALDEEMFVSLIQNQIAASTTLPSMAILFNELGEELIYAGGFESRINSGLSEPKPVVPDFFKVIAKSNFSLDFAPKTAKIMIERYDRVFGKFGAQEHKGLRAFSAENGLHLRLIEKMIDAYRANFVSLDDWNHQKISRKTRAEILNMGATQSLHNKTREEGYKAIIESCRGVDMIAAKNLFDGVLGQVVKDISYVNDGFENQREVLKHYPQAKGLLLEQDLGI
ncbi:hypothetical protein [Pseudomonas putida]|uniref:Uncharacterized protein n=1 Tax=Pseudomonas putida TaxID=303 RepID=A0A8I1EB98_PSEPU|nr:hypothetical protein [Pseudomonas putida]MBI6882481.1 hypothetical protein [Pseudomonas putida]